MTEEAIAATLAEARRRMKALSERAIAELEDELRKYAGYDGQVGVIFDLKVIAGINLPPQAAIAQRSTAPGQNSACSLPASTGLRRFVAVPPFFWRLN